VTFGQFLLGDFFQARLHQAWPHLHLRGHMTHRATAGLLADVLSQAFGGALSPAARLICFGETAPAAWTTKAPLQQHQHDAMPSQRHIALASWARIMHFDAHPLTVRALRSLSRGDHFDFDTAILLKDLLEYTPSSQV
jgi:hypothetical protein